MGRGCRKTGSAILAATLAIFFVASAAAGPRYPTGLAPIDARELADIPVVPLTRAYIPEAADLSDRFPRPGRQENNSDVSWAAAYAARSYYNFAEYGGPRDDDGRIASPAYLHNHLAPPESCQSANTSLIRALNFLQQDGVPAIAAFGNSAMCKPDSSATPDAPFFHITGYFNVAFRPEASAAMPDTAVDRIKQQLANGNPVLFGMDVDDQFMALTGPAIYRANARAGGTGERGHAMVIVGYDDRRLAFRVFNSWGSGWGDGGYGWIAYDTFRSNATSAWVMDTGTPPPKPTASRPGLQGKSDFNLPCGDVRTHEVGNHTLIEGFVASEDDKKNIENIFDVLHGNGERPEYRIAVHPWPVCEALLTLAEPLAAPSVPRLATLSGQTKFRFNDALGLTLTAPDYPSFLYLVYFQSDGKVVNLLPRQGRIREQTAPGAEFMFGDGQQGRARFRVGPPRGTEAVIAIASRSPILEIEALETDGALYKVAAAAHNPVDQTETPPDRAFLSAMRMALMARPDPQALQREMSAAVLHLTIEP